MKKVVTTIVLLMLMIMVMIAIPVKAESAVTSGTNITSLKSKDQTDAKSSDLKENKSILNTDPTSTSSSNSEADDKTTSLVEGDETKAKNEPANKENTVVAESSSDLPKAGLSPIISFAITGIVILAIILYKKVIKYNI